MRYILLLLFLNSFYLGLSQSCTYTFIGELTDFHDGTPIVEATVYAKNLDKYVSSDTAGKFKFENLCKQKLILVISHIACETKTITIDITGDTFKAISLEHHIETLSEVAITSTANRTITKTSQETVINKAALEKYSALSLGDALKEVTGVSSINTGNAIVKPMINGMHSSRLIIMNNDVRLQDQEWGIEHAPNIDINSANQISVIKGAGALAYGGDAIGGVIVIKPDRVILRDSLFGKSTLGGQTNGRGINFNTALNKSYSSGWFANVQASLKQNGDFNAPDYNLTNTGLKSEGVSIRTGKRTFESGFEVFYSYLHNEIGILRASHIGSIGDLVDAINSQEPSVIDDFSYDINSPKQDVTHHLVKASYFKRFKNLGKLNVQYDYQNNKRLEYDVRVGSDRNKPALDLTLQTHTLVSDLVLDAKTGYNLKFGLLGRYQNNFADPETGVRRLIPDYDKYDVGVYAISEWKINTVLLLDAGLRYDFNRIDAKKFYRTSRWEERGYDEDFSDIIIEDLGTQLLTNPVFNYHNISASVGLKYTLNANSALLANYALASRPPNPSELFSDGLHHSAARIELGDLRLDQELSNRIAATYTFDTTRFTLTAELFYNHISDFMYLEPTGVEQTIRGAFPVWEYRQSDSEFYGLDLLVNYNLNEHLNITNRTSYTVGNDLENDRPLIDIPPLSTINSVSYRNTNWNSFNISLVNEWVFEQTQYPDNNFEVFIPSTNETVLVDVSTPPPAYNLFHFNSDVTFDLSSKTQLKITLQINNLLNTNYRAYLNRLRYFADDLGRNAMLQLQLNY